MKSFFRFTLCCFIFSSCIAYSQNVEFKKAKVATAEDESIMFKFEPNYKTTRVQHRETLLKRIKALDSLPISDKKRLRLIKEIYRNSHTDKFQKAMLINAKFEDDDYQE